MTSTLTDDNLLHIALPLRALAVPIDSLNLDPANARLHDEKNLAAITGSLARFGQRLPIVVQEQGRIVRAGNGRVMAAKALGWSHIAAVVVDESEVEATAFAIADNRSSELAQWDDEALAKLLQSLPGDALAATGFSDDELAELLDSLSPETVEEDDTPAVQTEAVSRVGDLWLLGGHRLLCGDSTRAADVLRVMEGRKAALCQTDPPSPPSPRIGRLGRPRRTCDLERCLAAWGNVGRTVGHRRTLPLTRLPHRGPQPLGARDRHRPAGGGVDPLPALVLIPEPALRLDADPGDPARDLGQVHRADTDILLLHRDPFRRCVNPRRTFRRATTMKRPPAHNIKSKGERFPPGFDDFALCSGETRPARGQVLTPRHPPPPPNHHHRHRRGPFGN